MLQMEMLWNARSVLSGVINKTPLIPAGTVGEGGSLFLKAECLQKTGAFKLRGAYYKIATLTEEEKYKNHKVIILVHSWLDTAGNRIKNEGYTLRPCNWAEAVWEKLVYPSKNIVMVLCGHTGAAPKIEGDVASTNFKPTSSYRVDKAADGRDIPQMMFNSQQGDGDWNGNGGDCWLRILEFKPDGKTISVRTFSPMFAISRLTQHLAWRTAEYDQFDIVIK